MELFQPDQQLIIIIDGKDMGLIDLNAKEGIN